MSTVLGLIGVVVYIPAILVAARRHVRRREVHADDDGRSGQGEGLDRRVPRTIVTVAATATAFAAIGVCAGGTSTQAPPSGALAFTCGTGTEDDDDDICTVGADGRGLRRLTAGPEWDRQPSWSPDRRWIAFVRSTPVGTDEFVGTIFRDDLYIVSASGRTQRRVAKDLFAPYEWPAAWSPNSRRLVFMNGDIWSVNVDGTGLRRLTRGSNPDPARGVLDRHPTWSRDGRRIAFSRSSGPGADRIFVMAPTGAGARAVGRYRPSHDESDPAWSPDSGRIAFVDQLVNQSDNSTSDNSTSVSVINADGSGLKRLTSSGFSSPKWSPDGKTILYEDILVGGRDVLDAVPARGGRKRLLAVNAENAEWSPDGQWIAHISNRHALFIMRAGGSGKHRIASSIAEISDVDW